MTDAPGTMPDKTYFKISEAARITGLKTHTLRYWESEFKIIKPQRAGSKQRLYRKVDLEKILQIKRLINEEGLTIAGTKKRLAKESKKDFAPPAGLPPDPILLREIKTELLEIKNILK